ncbi:unnamed protein product [Adineta ricciae]|uniref:Methyltransferase FkbM domain-containing protein n=1 Tax=Adineta ricciae TaxID=249248 RepID=A0A815BB06_ADIRI|nr:unnamed protein product [Adineta ricciae]CAF1268002.1 unnamed protein product [Adineta ricciae]
MRGLTYNITSIRNILKLFLFTTLSIITLRLIGSGYRIVNSQEKETSLELSPHVIVVDPDDSTLNRNFTCITTQVLMNVFQTSLCLHSKHDTVSKSVAERRVWEENDVSRLLNILIRNPEMQMIDIGANIGGFTMFIAGALGRFTLAIECYRPSIERIARAVQLRNAQKNVVLVQNALYSDPGKYLTITTDDPSGIRLQERTTEKESKNEFVVKTIKFDDLLPILIQRKVKTAMIKIDIETSESYICATGAKIFDQINIPYIMMEWHSWRVKHQQRYQYIVDFMTARGYIPVDASCKELNPNDWLNLSWPGNIFWIKKSYPRNLLC